jgi:hypothetical protein
MARTARWPGRGHPIEAARERRAPKLKLHCCCCCCRCCRAWITSCLQLGDSSGKCCLTQDHRRPPPGCSWLQNWATSDPQATRNGRIPGDPAPGGCAPEGGAPGGPASGGCASGAPAGGCPSCDCAFAPEPASVRMTATAKASLTMLASLLWRGGAHPHKGPTSRSPSEDCRPFGRRHGGRRRRERGSERNGSTRGRFPFSTNDPCGVIGAAATQLFRERSAGVETTARRGRARSSRYECCSNSRHCQKGPPRLRGGRGFGVWGEGPRNQRRPWAETRRVGIGRMPLFCARRQST